MNIRDLDKIPAWEWPEDADQTVMGVLTDDHADESDRCLAAELASEYVILSDRLVDTLLSVLKNKNLSDELRGKAAIALGPGLEDGHTMGFDDDDVPISEETFDAIRRTLRELFDRPDLPKLVRRRVLEAAVRAPEDWQKEAILDAYKDKDAEWRLTAVFCMGFFQGFDKQIVEALKSDDENILYEAVVAAGNWEIDGAWRQIASIVTDPDTERGLLLAAIEAAASIRPDRAGELFADLLETGDDEIQEAILDILDMAAAMKEDRAEEDDYDDEVYDDDDLIDDDEDDDDDKYN